MRKLGFLDDLPQEFSEKDVRIYEKNVNIIYIRQKNY